MIVITGPTGVGKTDISLQLSRHCNAEIINADMGQMYQPLSVGTAKPEWKIDPIRHHLFDILQEPSSYTVTQYHAAVLPLMEQLWHTNKIPLVVGGSGFYIKSLFFPPRADVAQGANPDSVQQVPGDTLEGNGADRWEQLNAIDPERAAKLHPNDHYRLERALALWHTTHTKPSALLPAYTTVATSAIIVHLTRDRDELYERIDKRVEQMMQQGWMEEVKNLIETDWASFIQNKKIIGYNELVDFIKTGNQSAQAYTTMIARIQQRTRHYAKRQETFWRGFVRLMEPYAKLHAADHQVSIIECNLTTMSVDECVEKISSLYKKARSFCEK
jgi:tRNA dimethylallyltransferase